MTLPIQGGGRPADGYRLPNGTKVPSVTEVLGSHWAEGKRRSIGGYREGQIRQGNDPDAELRRAGNVGSALHERAERALTGDLQPMPIEGEEGPLALAWAAWCAWNTSRREGLALRAIEVPLVSPVWGFGGTPDLVAVVNAGGRRALRVIDWKTSRTPREPYPEHVLQLGAYWHLLSIGISVDPSVSREDMRGASCVEGGAIIYCDKHTGKPTEFLLSESELYRAARVFKARLQLMRLEAA